MERAAKYEEVKKKKSKEKGMVYFRNDGLFGGIWQKLLSPVVYAVGS